MYIKISVTHAQEADEDIFKPGTLVVDCDGWVVLVSHDKSEFGHYFAGTILTTNNDQQNYRVGDHCSEWNKLSFILFTGTITMEQGK